MSYAFQGEAKEFEVPRLAEILEDIDRVERTVELKMQRSMYLALADYYDLTNEQMLQLVERYLQSRRVNG